MPICSECQGTGTVVVLSKDPATGEWTHSIKARCSACPEQRDEEQEPTDLEPTEVHVELGGSD